MKRKKILERNTSQSKILFSNKTKFVETKNMEITATKVYKVGDKEYSSKEDAVKAAAMEVLQVEVPQGIDNVIAKSTDIIAALKVLGRKK